MKMTVVVGVDDALSAMGISGVLLETSEPTFEVSAEVDEGDIEEAAPDPEPFELHDVLDQNTVIDLTSAIRRGDTAEAELMLDRLLGEDSDVAHWIEVARYSRKARRSEPIAVRAAA